MGKLKVEAVSKCRSDVSKRRFAWLILRTRDVEAVEARTLERVEVDVEAASKRANFDTRARTYRLERVTRPLEGSLTPAERQW